MMSLLGFVVQCVILLLLVRVPFPHRGNGRYVSRRDDDGKRKPVKLRPAERFPSPLPA